MKPQYIKINEYGDKYYYSDKEMIIHHRDDGPAYEAAKGHKMWFLNGERHREDGAAVEWANGDKSWYLNNKRHREDGAAFECVDGYKSWYLNDVKYSEAEFNRKMNPTKININGREFTIEELNSLIASAEK